MHRKKLKVKCFNNKKKIWKSREKISWHCFLRNIPPSPHSGILSRLSESIDIENALSMLIDIVIIHGDIISNVCTLLTCELQYGDFSYEWPVNTGYLATAMSRHPQLHLHCNDFHILPREIKKKQKQKFVLNITSTAKPA